MNINARAATFVTCTLPGAALQVQAIGSQMSCHVPEGCARSIAQQAIDLLGGLPLLIVFDLFELSPRYMSESVLAVGLPTNSVVGGYVIYVAVTKTSNLVRSFMLPSNIALLRSASLITTWVASFSVLLASLDSIKVTALTLAGISTVSFVVFRAACYLSSLFKIEQRIEK